MALSQELLDLLVCPRCKGELEYREQEEVLACASCGLAYPVEDDIPIMLIDRAHTLDEPEGR